MVSKTQPVIPPPPVHLETIYEESGGSLSSSVVDIQLQSRNRQKSSTPSTNQTIHGLISARSIPSVDAHRRRRTNEQKLPIEVRYRDGTKRFIQPSSTTAPVIVNRRKYSHSSRHDSLLSTKLNAKYRQIFNTTPKKKKKLGKKTEIMLTIITAEDLSQAGVSPPSTSSPDESDTCALMKSQSNSSLDTFKTVQDISLDDMDEVSSERLPTATVLPLIETVQPVIDISISNVRTPAASRHRSQYQQQLRHPQQNNSIRSQSLPASQSHLPPSIQHKSISNQPPPIAIVPPSPKKTPPSLQITLTSSENERNLSTNINLPNIKTTSSRSSNETMNSQSKRSLQPPANILVGGGSRSAFRPFHKSITINSQPRIPPNNNLRSQQQPTNQVIHNSLQQQHIIPPSHPQPQLHKRTSISTTTRFPLLASSTIESIPYDRRSISSDASSKQVNSIKSNKALSDKVISSTSQMKASNYSQQLTSKSTINIIDNSFNKISKSKDVKSNSVAIDPTLQWHSVTSKSLYDVPRLSHKYSSIPLRITLPDATPTHNQRLVHKHDIELEKRLLDAGLSPETIALYERILEVADIDQMDTISPPDIIDQYQHESLL